MRLSCPGCQTKYEVPDTALAGRVRTLRCAHCGHQWEYGPLPAALANAEIPETEAAWQASSPVTAYEEPKPAESLPANAEIPETTAAWQASSLVAAYEEPKPAESLPARETTYEPIDPPARDSWPPPPEPIDIQEPFKSMPAFQPSWEPADITTPAERALVDSALTERSLDEPAYLPETTTQPGDGNEERFAALVRTSRDEPDAEVQPPRRKSSGVLITILLVIGICAGIWFARFQIMQVWPPSTRLFSAINNAIAAFTTAPHH